MDANIRQSSVVYCYESNIPPQSKSASSPSWDPRFPGSRGADEISWSVNRYVKISFMIYLHMSFNRISGFNEQFYYQVQMQL